MEGLVGTKGARAGILGIGGRCICVQPGYGNVMSNVHVSIASRKSVQNMCGRSAILLYEGSTSIKEVHVCN